MRINNLIGVSGTINTGKDLVGDMLMYIGEYLTREPSYDGFIENEIMKKNKYRVETVTAYKIKKCAEKLKEMVAILIGCERSDLEDEEFKNKELGEEWWYYTRDFDNKLTTLKEYEGCSANQKTYYTLVKLTPRLILQLLGTQGGRMVIHPNIWVNALFSEYKPTYFGGIDPALDDPDFFISTSLPKWIITDIRFPENEGVAVTERNGLLIGIRRYFALKQPKYAHLIDPNNPYDIPSKLEELNVKLYKSLTHESETSMTDHSWCDVIIENNGTIEDLFNNVLNAVTKN